MLCCLMLLTMSPDAWLFVWLRLTRHKSSNMSLTGLFACRVAWSTAPLCFMLHASFPHLSTGDKASHNPASASATDATTLCYLIRLYLIDNAMRQPGLSATERLIR